MTSILVFLILLSATVASAGQTLSDPAPQQLPKNFDPAACDSEIADMRTSRFCAQISFQKSDSAMKVHYNKLLSLLKEHSGQAHKTRFIKVQKDWERLRDEHCKIYSDYYKESLSGHTISAAYWSCLKEMTNSRTAELITLIQLYAQDPAYPDSMESNK
jgi:uncharacterized protein YecT (DUF1311 family)